MRQQNNQDPTPSPNASPLVVIYDDPKPPAPGATAQEISSYRSELAKYSDEALTAFKSMSSMRELFWEDFTTTFRPDGIGFLSSIAVISWRDLLLHRNIYVAHGRTVNRKEALKAVILAEEWPRFPGTDGEQISSNGKRNNERGNRSSMTISRSTNESHAMRQIAKTYQSRNKFSGSFDDDLHESLQTFETFSEMYGLSEQDKSVSLPILLDGDALLF
jgi:hypothetical protein